MTDEELIHNILSGDQHAIHELHERYVDRIFNYIYIQTNSYHDTEELLQDVFLKAANRLDRFKGHASFKTWIFKISRNIVIDYYRKRKKEQRSFTMDQDTMEGIAGEYEAAETTVLRNIHMDEVFETIERLPDNYRMILHLRFVEDFSITETAEIMGKTALSIKSAQRRARLALHEKLNLEVSN
ncbi:RNA polymerase sigma factor [Salipaludibacillus aurantiacus]|uniref:RNA polymerase sigma-70 factor, ECF subfamily n=1 Tax=Salipaludibacillus aurantiacus TaxID=1601833 RepID=A0A1H9Q9D5_9BACI|nr:sigma-70 family RNA polymerase sigma factor [Salipaludibacillus aurantiacus]SER57121.1 RNA polymerase sigma-70 factor, ECF subfamily [Salipaludibacillus aurantiacus]